MKKSTPTSIKLVTVIALCAILAAVVISRLITERASATLTEAPEQSSAAISATLKPAETTSPSAATQNAKTQALKKTLSNELSIVSGVWSVTYTDLSDGSSFTCTKGIAEDKPMVSASLIKLYVMGAVYKQIEAGAIKESDVTDTIYKMITVSDNDATNKLIKILGNGDTKAGMVKVNNFAAEIDCKGSTMNRLMLENNGLQNYTTTADCAHILNLIYSNKCVSSVSSKKMLQLLSAQTRLNKIPAGLPAGTKCANKTGELTGLSECDAAIIFTEKGNYILCIMSEPNDNAAAISEIIKISKTCYNSFIS